MKRIIAIIITSLMLFSTVAIAQTATTTPTTTPPLTVNNPVDHLTALINATPTTTPIHSRLIIIRNNRDKITGLRATTTLRVTALGLLIAPMTGDDDNETLEKARDIVEGFEDRMQSGIQHDRQIQRQIKELHSQMSRFRQIAASQGPNNSNDDKRETRIRNGRRNDDGERKNGNGTQNLRQNRRSERNETQTIRRIGRIIKSQERIIDRLEGRLERIEDLIVELTP